MHVAKNELVLIYNSQNHTDRKALGYAQGLHKHELRAIDVQKETLSATQLGDIANHLETEVKDLIDRQSQVYKDQFQAVELDDEDVLKALAEHHDLLKTPIVLTNSGSGFLDSSYDLIREDMQQGGNNKPS